jgi:uncharacterized protein YqjF (DUF2071 family)
MALGNLTRVKQSGQKEGPIFHDLVTLAGDAAYASGGSAGFLAKYRALSGRKGAEILAVVDQSQPDTLSALEYDHTNDKLFARVRTTGVESAVSDQSAVTYRLLVIAK